MTPDPAPLAALRQLVAQWREEAKDMRRHAETAAAVRTADTTTQQGLLLESAGTCDANADDLAAVLDRLEAQIDAVPAAAQTLVDTLDAVHADPRYQAVWVMYQVHGGQYTEPTYTAELAALRVALESRRKDLETRG